MNYSSLSKYLNDIFILQYDHKFRYNDIMEWMPFERDIFTDMINQRLADEREIKRLEARQAELTANGRRI